jgi:hypothetical protein
VAWSISSKDEMMTSVRYFYTYSNVILITIRTERSESLAVSPHQATSTSPERIRIAEIPTSVCFPAIPNTRNYCAEYQEASEGEPARAGFFGVEFVALCFGSGEDSRRYRNRDDTTEGVALESDNSEHEGI